jgi:hypothetical protein
LLLQRFPRLLGGGQRLVQTAPCLREGRFALEVQVRLLRQFAQRLVASNGCLRHLRLKYC